jgi:hypothetical protein
MARGRYKLRRSDLRRQGSTRFDRTMAPCSTSGQVSVTAADGADANAGFRLEKTRRARTLCWAFKYAQRAGTQDRE